MCPPLLQVLFSGKMLFFLVLEALSFALVFPPHRRLFQKEKFPEIWVFEAAF